ncbi:MAG: hypothetical protein RL477_1393 [Pseudomonadota bacterium]
MAIEVLTFLALGLLLEGVLFALFPGAVSRALRDIAAWPLERLRAVGLTAAVLGTLGLAGLAALAGEGGAMAFGFPRLRAVFAWLS